MHTHLAEIVAEPRLKETPYGLGQRLPTTSQGANLRLQTGTYLGSLAASTLCLDALLFFLFFFWLDLPLNQWPYLIGKRFRLNWLFLIPTRGISFKGSGRCQLNTWLRHAHDHVRHSVCFLFVPIIRLVDGQFGLKQGRL